MLKESGVASCEEGGHPNAWRDDNPDWCPPTSTMENTFNVFTHSTTNRLSCNNLTATWACKVTKRNKKNIKEVNISHYSYFYTQNVLIILMPSSRIRPMFWTNEELEEVEYYLFRIIHKRPPLRAETSNDSITGNTERRVSNNLGINFFIPLASPLNNHTPDQRPPTIFP